MERSISVGTKPLYKNSSKNEMNTRYYIQAKAPLLGVTSSLVERGSINAYTIVRMRVRRYLSVFIYIILSSNSRLYLMTVPIKTMIIGIAMIRLKIKAGRKPMADVILGSVPIFLKYELRKYVQKYWTPAYSIPNKA